MFSLSLFSFFSAPHLVYDAGNAAMGRSPVPVPSPDKRRGSLHLSIIATLYMLGTWEDPSSYRKHWELWTLFTIE
jgi:hypothetical protein